MKSLELSWNTENELPEVGEKLLQWAANQTLFLINGEMGVGKTALIRSIANNLGSRDQPGSPTFSIVNVYRISGKYPTMYHADLYRLKTSEEAWDAGLEELMYDAEALKFIEWPELIIPFLPEHWVNIEITADTQGKRTLRAESNI